MGDPLLEVGNLRIEFPTRRGALVAVDNISFSTGIPAPDRRIDHHGYEEPIGGCRRP
jgi:ABC-type dipeptide/oligopeptide/nickel transport system ATPase component